MILLPLANSPMGVVYSGMESMPLRVVSSETPQFFPSALHLLQPIGHRPGMLFLICERAPLLTMQCDAGNNPKTCPICGVKNPAQDMDILPNRKKVLGPS